MGKIHLFLFMTQHKILIIPLHFRFWIRVCQGHVGLCANSALGLPLSSKKMGQPEKP